MWPKARFVFAVLSLASIVTAPGCAEERDPINQVQIGALPKSFFVGSKLDDASDDPEFYYRTTVVDVAAGAGAESLFTSSDSQPTVRVRWEITETKLIARLAYELIDDTDGAGKTPTKAEGKAKAPAQPTTNGQVVASFAIEKQFDIRRGYNESTGEENNVIVENDHDRPWNQRGYIRVDWSTNLVTDAYDLDATSQMGLWGGVKWDPISYQINDTNSPDAPVIDIQEGYFDITNKAFAAPQMIHDEEFGDFPACYLVGSYPRVSCNPSEVKLRLSFRRLTPTDYEPLDFDGSRMEMFGYFTNDRFGYDRQHGLVDDKWHRFASRWNVYEKSHVEKTVACATLDTTPPGANPHRDDDSDGTEDECSSAGEGSRCDEFAHACTIPLVERKVKTIPWHVNSDFPEDLFPSASKVVKAWSDAIRVGILSGRLAECRRTGKSGCEDTMGWPARWSDDFVPPLGKDTPNEVAEVFVLCHNPVDPTKGDDALCGKAGTRPRLGDLRYNFFNYVLSPQVAAPWGIMVDAEDPLTGEKISGSVNMFGATLDRAAGNLVDLVSLLNGVTPPTAFIEGKDVTDWVNDNRPTGKRSRPAPMTAAELTGRLSAFDPKVMAAYATGTSKGAHRAPAKLRHQQRLKALADSGKLGMGNGAIAQRANLLRGTAIEAKMITPDVAQMAGVDPTAAITKATIDRATPLGTNTPMLRRALARRNALGRSSRHACRREAPEADHLLSLAKRAQKLFGIVDPKNAADVAEQKAKIYQWAREQYALGVYSHEFGHSVGLRHNFAGTFDSLNYDENYWQLRTKNGSVTKTCAPGTTDGSSCIGPRYADPLTDEEIDRGINGFATSSVMDYPGDQALDMFLMGKYDRAAVRFGYGGVVDVWAAPGVTVSGSGDGKVKAYELTAFATPPGLFGVYDFPDPVGETKHLHYSQYAAEFGLVSDCKSDSDSPLGKRCNGAPMDVVDYRDMKDFVAIPEYAAFATMKAVTDPKGRVRRGYIFSSDEYADSGNVPAFSFDMGADPYEQVRFLESVYENRYVVDDFRRSRTEFNSWDVVWKTQTRYLDPIQLIAKTYAFAMVLDVDDPTNPPADLLADGYYGPLGAATSIGFDLFTRALTRPEPGSYCSPGSDDCSAIQPPGLVDYIYGVDPYPVPSMTTYDFGLGLGTGRYVHNDFDYGKGYWWSDYQKQVGSFYDKTWAIYYLSEAFDSFISNSREDFIDGRYKNVNFATIYPEQTRRLFGALLTGDIESFAPYAETETSGKASAELVYPEWHLKDGLGTRPANAKLVDPSFGWNEQLYAMVWGTMFFPTSWSNTFVHDARITALENEQVSWPAAETIIFNDPVTHLTYRAHTAGTEELFGVARQKSIGARMLDWANNLLLEAYICEVDKDGYYVFNADGTPKLVLKDGQIQPNPDFPGGVGALRSYVANLDVMRQLVSTFVRPLADALPSP